MNSEDEKWALVSMGYSAYIAVPLAKLHELIETARFYKSNYDAGKNKLEPADTEVDIKLVPYRVLVAADAKARMLQKAVDEIEPA